MHFGTPTERMKQCYTAVLKVHLVHLMSCKSTHIDLQCNVFLLFCMYWKCIFLLLTCVRSIALQGHIGLDRLVFPEGTLGSRFDCIARLPLWDLGLDFNHGTGHGVGSFLNVHEGPQGIGFRKRENEVVRVH